MKHYFTSRFFLLVFTLLGCFVYANGQNLQVVKNWNFLSWSTETQENLAADAANWLVELDAETQAIKRYKNVKTVSTSEFLKADNVVIAETDGILFPALTANNLSLRLNMGDDGIQLGSKNLDVTIKGLKADQQVSIVIKSANATAARGISAVTNMSGTVGTATYKTGDEGLNTYEFKVTANGDVKFKYSDGIILKSIAVSEEVIPSKVAFIYDSGFSGYTLANDPIHTALIAAFEVTDIDVNALDGSTITELRAYDLVFSAEAVAGTHKYGLALKEVVNQVPMLNLKSFYYSSGRWGWATGQNPDKGTNTMIIAEAYRSHEIFNGVSIAEDGTCVIFTNSDNSNNQVQAYKDPLALIADDIVFAKDGTNTYNTIHEHGTTNKYMLIPLASNLIAGIDANGIKLILNAANYLIASKEVYVEPSDPVVDPVISSETNGKAKTVTISCETEGVTIYYTIDGSTPTAASLVYAAPFDIIRSCTVKALAVKEGMLNSGIISAEIINENYVERNKDLLWANFKDQPVEWGVTGDIIGAGKTEEKTIAGIIVGSKGQRVNLQNTGVSEEIGGNYGPATEADAGATSYAMSFLKGSASAYMITTEPLQGPFDINVWWCGAKSDARTEKLILSVKTAEAEEWTEVGTISTMSFKKIVKQTVSYDGNEAVLIKVSSASENGDNNNAMIFDVKVMGEGENFVEKAKVAYVFKSDYSAKWSKDTDPIYAALAETFDVTDVDVNTADVAAITDLRGYDLVVAAEAINGGNAYGNALVNLVNEVPMLNFKSYHYSAGRWSWGTGANPAQKGTISVVVEEAYKNHAIFKDVAVAEDGTCQIFAESVDTENQIQGYTAGEMIENDPVLAKVETFNAIHERGTDNKYMLIPISSDAITKVGDNGIKLVVNAANYLISTKVPYVEPTEPVITPVIAVATSITNEKAKTVTITTETEDAIIYYTLDGSDPTIKSPVYTAAFDITKPCTVKAFGAKAGMINSEIVFKDVENENYVARNKTVLWANFKDQPAAWGVTGDIIASGTTDEKTIVGFTIGSKGQRINLQNTGVSDEIGATYGPATEEDAGATSYAMSFLTGSASAYMITPSAVAGPFDISVWWCMAKGASYTEKLTVSVKTAEAEEWTELGTLSNSSYKVIRKQSIAYDGTDPVLVKLASASGNGSNNNAMIFDIKLFAEGEDAVATPVITESASTIGDDAKLITITCATEGASIYYTIDGNIPTSAALAYSEPFEVTSTCTVKAIAVKEGRPDSDVASLDVTIIPTSIGQDTVAKVVLSRSYFTVGGTEISEPAIGLNIVKTVYEDGTIEVSKVIVK